MGILAEAVIAAFDSNTNLVWTATGTKEARASFTLGSTHVTVTFSTVDGVAWRVGFDVESKASALENIHSSIRIFSGVFQAVGEFLEVRQPQRLLFASKVEALGELNREYLRKQETTLSQMGYRMAPVIKMTPLAEFTIEKTTPSEWRGGQ